MREEFSNIKFEEVAFSRYVKVKESIENLTKIIDYEKVKEDGIDRVLHAILQLIDENDDKAVDEKKELIEDAIYNGNIFRHYFSEENQAKAVDILSKTSLLNDEERLIYIINFFMPSDVNFSSIYSKNEKNIDKIAEYYNLNETDSANLVYARVAEISKFHKLYQEEKERQKIQSSDNSQDESLEKDNEIEELLIPEDSTTGDISGEMDTYGTSEITEDEVETTEETVLAEEPAPLEQVLENEVSVDSEQVGENVGKDVMQSLQALVATAKENAKKAEQLSLDLEEKDEKIVELKETITAKEEEIASKDKEIEAKNVELQEKEAALTEANKTITLRDEEIKSLTTSLNSYKTSLEEIQDFLSSAQYVSETPEKPKKIA